MICPFCGTSYDTLVCSVCAARISREAFLDLQKSYLPAVIAGRLFLHLTRKKRSDAFHLQLFGDKTHTYCGEQIPTGWFHERTKYSEGIRAGFCESCVAVFDRLREKAEREAQEAKVLL